MKIGKHEIGYGKPVFIVAEAGINHNGDLQIAKKLIKSAAECGANAVKFQTFFPDEEFSETLNPDWYALAKVWSFTKKQDNIKLREYSRKNGIEFFSTASGIKSAKFLKDLGIKCIKIASGSITNHDFLKDTAKMKIPMIISTGTTTISEIASVVELVKNENCEFVLLHCNSSYPTPIEDANISTIPYLRNTFGVPIGYSDHTLGIEACLAAVSLGACVVEKHFTLDKNMEGPDQKLSADPQEFSEMVSRIRMIEKSLGTRRMGPTKSEKDFVKLMRYSIGAASDIKAGTKLTRSMLGTFRPGIGISPYMIDNIVGLKLKKSIKKGTPLTWKLF